MRTGDVDAHAAKIVRNGLEQMPLDPHAAHLKGIADRARAIAKAQFDTKEANPAYKAAVEDNVPRLENGLHDLTQPSPLAGKFLDTFSTGNAQTASPVNVQRLKQAVPSADLSQAIEGHALNTLATASGAEKGKFTFAKYRDTLNGMGEDKQKVLFQPETIDNLQRLKRVAQRTYHESAADFNNRSNSYVALADHGAIYPKDLNKTQQLMSGVADVAGDLAAAKAAAYVGPFVAFHAKNMLKGYFTGMKDAEREKTVVDAKHKWLNEATKTGAGLTYRPPGSGSPPLIQRAAGGKVTDDMLVNRLTRRWQAAKRATDETTKPLLNQPDNAIIRALEIAQEHL
jgi:hypothetical protein